MTYEIYVFGSAARGEIAPSSDMDVLVVDTVPTPSAFPKEWSVYSKRTIEGYYNAGRLFAWHLHLEAIRIYPKSGISFLSSLGTPTCYSSAQQDLADLRILLSESIQQLQQDSPNLIYELGLIYTAIRDIAMAASWSIVGRPCFGRYVPYQISPTCPLPRSVYDTAMSARHASIRGADEPKDYLSAAQFIQTSPVLDWVDMVRSATCQTPF